MKLVLVVATVIGAVLVNGLEHYDNFREGACSGIWSKPETKASSPMNIDVDWVDTLHYNSAGSKYHLYKMASAHPRFESMSEDEFYYGFCYMRNASSSSPVAVGTGFGRNLETWDVRTRPDLPGVYIEATPRTVLSRWDTLRQRITLTDNKSFAFLLNCWTGSNERAWNVVSNTPLLSAQARKMIENHATALGFSRNNFIFLRYDSCQAENPLLGKRQMSRLSSEGIRKGSAAFWQPPATATKAPVPVVIKTTPRPLRRVTIPPTSTLATTVSHSGSGWSRS